MNLMTVRPPWADDELDALRELVRDFLASEAVPRQSDWERRQRVDREFWLRAGELGLLCASIPEEYGGAGGRFAHEAVISEEQSRAMVTGWGNQILRERGAEVRVAAADGHGSGDRRDRDDRAIGRFGPQARAHLGPPGR
jgi:alkylation response protein AidB-like acyl-CoA dehydrogenase